MKPLRAVVKRSDGEWFEAQLLELDLAVGAPSLEELVKQIEYTLVLDYHIAHELKETPFISRWNKTPAEFHAWWRSESPTTTTHTLKLPDCVAEALAIAIRSNGEPSVVVQQYAAAA